MSRVVVSAFAAAHLLFAQQASAQPCEPAHCRAAAAELSAMCTADAGQLWAVSLCGPLIVVDPKTRAVWASAPDQDKVLSSKDGGWTGVLPEGVPVANTSIEWSGQRWIMVVSLPKDPTERRVLLAHEAWHRIQSEIGLQMPNVDNAHLDDERGRYLLRTEMRALSAAIQASGEARRRAARDALQFRGARIAHYPSAAAEEAALDRNEGLAAYTGVKLGAEDASGYVVDTLARHDASTAHSRSYAYATGPAYGLILDEQLVDWRKKLGEQAPADLLSQTLRVRLSAEELERAASRHDPDGAIARAEAERGTAHRALVAKLREQYAKDTRRVVLRIDPQTMTFDPRRVTPLEGLGRVFGVFTARGEWGSLRAEDGALVTADFTQVTLKEPAADGLNGPGWTLSLTPGYRISQPAADGVMSLIPPP